MQLVASAPSDGCAQGGRLQEPSAASEGCRMATRSRTQGRIVRLREPSVPVAQEERGVDATRCIYSKRRRIKVKAPGALARSEAAGTRPTRTLGR